MRILILGFGKSGQASYNHLKEYIYSKSPGDKVNVEITRNKSNEELSVVLGKK